MNSEEKERIRDRLGARYFIILAEGMCPYCGRKLVPARQVPDEWFERVKSPRPPDEMLDTCDACISCVSIWSRPEFEGDGDTVERMRNVWRSHSKKGGKR